MKRRFRACLAVALALSVLPGCTRSVDGSPHAAHASSGGKSSPAQPAKDYDIGRLSKVQTEFPPGFGRVQAMHVATLGPAADNFSTIGVGEVVGFNPPKCQALLQPVRPPRDAQFTMVAGVGIGAIMVSAVKSRAALPTTTAPAGCNHAAVTRKVSRRLFKSVIKRVPGPSIAGVPTTGSMDVAPVGGARSYVFAALLGDTVAVVVQGMLPGNPRADDTMRNLLVKAVAAIRAH